MMNNKSSNQIMNMTAESSVAFHSLSEEQKIEVQKLSNAINVTKVEKVLEFGSDIQTELKHFTHQLFVQVQGYNTNAIRETLFSLQKQLEKMDTNQLSSQQKNPLAKLFSRNKKSMQLVTSEYLRLSKIVDKMSIQLQYAKDDLIQENQLLDRLFNQNNHYYNQLTLHILAGEMKKQELIQNELKQYEEVYASTKHPMDYQKLEDIKNVIDWLDKRIYEMEISKEIALQTAPQIRMMQETNNMLIEKIQTSILTTIPLWQSQISMIVNLNKQQRLNQSANKLNDQISSGLQQSNANLKTTITELKNTHANLIDSIEEALTVQEQQEKQQTTLEQTIEEFSKD